MHDVLIVGGAPRITIEEIEGRLQRDLAGTAVERAILFGSFARGQADAMSDVDLLLIEPTERPFLERGLAHLPLFRWGVGVDLLVYTPAEYAQLAARQNPLIARIEQEGVTVYARSGR
jgi:predicted nucleotidyltransferase